MNRRAGFVADGFRRLLSSPEFRRGRAAIDAKVRVERAAELSAATGYWRRVALEQEIRREVERRVGMPSRQALFVSR
jgi:hypothetical protein